MAQSSKIKSLIALFIIGWVIIFIEIAHAQDEKPEWMAKDAPNAYVVKKGDTLWEIACIFLRDPWRWQDIWYANPGIQNPNLIYPGDRLVLSYHQGKPRLTVDRDYTEQTVDRRTGVVKLHPRIRKFPADKPVPTIPLHVIGPFFNQSRVVTERQAKECPPIVSLDEDHITVGTGDYIYVSDLRERKKDKVYSVFRPNKDYIDPKTKKLLGIEGLVLGKAQLEVPGDTARLRILNSYEEIYVGDRIITTLHEEIDAYFVPKRPIGPARGQILSVFGGINQIGQYQVIAISGGANIKRDVGDVLVISQTQKDIPSRLTFQADKKYQYPPLVIAICVVFRVFDEVSYALVMNSIRPIYLLDSVGRP